MTRLSFGLILGAVAAFLLAVVWIQEAREERKRRNEPNTFYRPDRWSDR
jgi:hypothetical protein